MRALLLITMSLSLAFATQGNLTDIQVAEAKAFVISKNHKCDKVNFAKKSTCDGSIVIVCDSKYFFEIKNNFGEWIVTVD